MTFVEAVRAWKAVTGRLPARVTMLLEGEEESGSTNLAPFLAANAEELNADLALVCDTDMWRRGHPAITVVLRGLVGEEVVGHRAEPRPSFGHVWRRRAQPDPCARRASWPALHDADGRVTLPGFYDGVARAARRHQRQWDGLGFDAGRLPRRGRARRFRPARQGARCSSRSGRGRPAR